MGCVECQAVVKNSALSLLVKPHTHTHTHTHTHETTQAWSKWDVEWSRAKSGKPACKQSQCEHASSRREEMGMYRARKVEVRVVGEVDGRGLCGCGCVADGERAILQRVHNSDIHLPRIALITIRRRVLKLDTVLHNGGLPYVLFCAKAGESQEVVGRQRLCVCVTSTHRHTDTDTHTSRQTDTSRQTHTHRHTQTHAHTSRHAQMGQQRLYRTLSKPLMPP